MDRTRARAAASARFIVGIVGPPGAGKSTIAADVVSSLNRSAGPVSVLLPMDGFHLPQARLVELGRRERMGAADTFDVDGFVRVLRLAREPGSEVVAPGFDRAVEEPIPGGIRIPESTRILVVEGNYLLHDAGGWERVAPLLHLSVFLHVERGIRLSRLVARHQRFGKSADDARSWALGPDEANARLIERTAPRADLTLAVE